MNENIIQSTKNKMSLAMDSLDKRLVTVRAGRANPSILEGVNANYYGSATPLKQLAIISVPEARQLLIKPFDKGALVIIEKAILEANLGLTPNNDGETLRIIIPALTEERRKELSKQTKSICEDAKVVVRNIRRDSIDEIDKSEISEDEKKHLEKEVQNLVDQFNKIIDEKLKAKEIDLMTV